MDEVREYLTADMPKPWAHHCDLLLGAVRGRESAHIGRIHLGVLESAFARFGEFVARSELRDRGRVTERVRLVLWATAELRRALNGDPDGPNRQQAIIYGTFVRMSIKQLFLYAERIAKSGQVDLSSIAHRELDPGSSGAGDAPSSEGSALAGPTGTSG